MKNFLIKLLPPNKKDVYFWFLFALAILPIIYICLLQMFNYMMLNTLLLSVIIGYFLYRIIQCLIFKRKILFPKSIAFILITFMFLWIFVGSFFSQNMSATWLGRVDGVHKECSVFQYIFYYLVAVCAINLDKKNIKHLFYCFLIVINTIIIIQIFKHDYGFGFINRNHTGYYLSISVCVTIGMLMKAKLLKEIIPLSISLVLHFTSFVLNNSFGPILGLLVYLVLLFIYSLIHNRQQIKKVCAIILSCVLIFSFFDFVPKVKELKSEPAPVITQLVDVSLVALNKVNIISDEKFNEIMGERGGMTPGADGYERFDMWGKSLNNMLEHPVFGVGVGAWNSVNSEFIYRAPHNEFLELGAIAGIPALLTYLALILFLFISFRKKHKKLNELSFTIFGAIIAYLVQSVFGNILPFTAPLFYVMIGLAIKFVSEKETQNILNDQSLEKNEKEINNQDLTKEEISNN